MLTERVIWGVAESGFREIGRAGVGGSRGRAGVGGRWG